MLHPPVICRANCETLKNTVAVAVLCAVRGSSVFERHFFLHFFLRISDFAFLPRSGVLSRARLHNAC